MFQTKDNPLIHTVNMIPLTICSISLVSTANNIQEGGGISSAVLLSGYIYSM